MKDNNKIQYSKVIPIATGLIFIACIALTVFDVVEKSAYVTCISVSGAIFASSIIWYMRKAQAENAFKLKSELYKIASDVRYNYNKKMIELQNQYNLSEDDIYKIEAQSPMDDIESEALGNLQSYANEIESEANEAVTFSQY